MVQCEKCKDWYHDECIGLTEAEISNIEQYYCSLCSDDSTLRTIYKIAPSADKPSGMVKPTPEVHNLPCKNSSAVVNNFYLDRISGSSFSQVGLCLKSCKTTTTIDSFILIQNPFFLCFIQNIAGNNFAKRLQFK